MVKTFAILLLLCAFYQTGWSLKCYACNSNSVPACADPPTISGITLHDCHFDKNTGPSNTVSCMKIVTEDTSNSKTNVTRKCMTHIKDTDPCKAPTPELKPPFKVQSCSFCDSDACNTATVPGLSILPFLPIVLGTWVHFYYYLNA